MSDAIFAILPGVGIFVTFVPIGYILDGKFDDQFRLRVFQALERTFPVETANGPDLFLSLFDRVFRTTAILRPSVFKSVLASILAALIITLLWLFSSWGSVIDLAYDHSDLEVSMVTVLFLVSVNIIGDFFSLWSSRYFIGRMANVFRLRSRIYYMLADLLSSIIIYILFLSTATILYILFLSSYRDTYLSVSFDQTVGSILVDLGSASYGTLLFIGAGLIEGGLLFSHENQFCNMMSIFFYTTLFTSIWVWIFLIGVSLWPILARLRSVLKVREYPIGSATMIGAVALGIGVSILFVAKTLVVLIIDLN